MHEWVYGVPWEVTPEVQSVAASCILHTHCAYSCPPRSAHGPSLLPYRSPSGVHIRCWSIPIACTLLLLLVAAAASVVAVAVAVVAAIYSIFCYGTTNIMKCNDIKNFCCCYLILYCCQLL